VLPRVLASALVLTVATAGAAAPTRRDADSMRQKVDAINQNALTPAAQVRRTTVTQNEVNGYLTYDAQPDLPPGLVEPSIAILGTGRLSGRAVVDLDAVRAHNKPASAMDPMSYLPGRVPVTATGTLTTSNGVGRFALESASIAGVPLPKMFLQELLSYYSRSPSAPGGISLDSPFALPARIREIQVLEGQAVVVQ